MKEITIKRLGLLALLDAVAGYLIYYTVKLGNTGAYADWTLYNLSVVGYWDGHEKELIRWGVITAVVFVGFLLYIRHLTGMKMRAVDVLAVLAGAFLIVGVHIPYQPWTHPVLSNVHIGCALLAPMSLLTGLTVLTARLFKSGLRGMAFLLLYLLLGAGGAVYLFVKYTIITTTLEVFTISALTSYMTIMTVILIIRGTKAKES